MIKKLGRYDIIDILGRGSMGVVYKGIDPQIGKLVAIKTMNPKVLTQKEMQERFYREGTILGQLQHKNIISVYNVGSDGDTCYIAMEYLEGTSLDKVMSSGEPMGHRRILNIIKQVCEGVNAAHKQSVTHRDLKPANIFLLEGDLVKVLDFGVAHFQNSSLTSSGMLLGTINYIAPEQITGLKVDYRADIFSIGVIMYELLTGINPFLGKNLSKTMVKIVNDEPEPPKNVPKTILTILDKALEKDRNKRYLSLRHMAADLDALLREMSMSGDDPGRTLPPPKPRIEVEPEVDDKKTQNDILQRMIFERIDGIKQCLRDENFDQAENLIGQLRRLKSDHPSLEDLVMKLDKGKRQAASKRAFAEKFHQETLLKANEHLSNRQYIQAVELCNKVLAVDKNNQDARVLRARGLRILEDFLREQKDAY